MADRHDFRARRARDVGWRRRALTGAIAALAVVVVAALAFGPAPSSSAQAGGPATTVPPTTAPVDATAPATAPPTAPPVAADASALPPLSARFEPPPDALPELSAQELYLEQGDGQGEDPISIWVIRFATAFPLPADGYRVSLVAGQPGGDQARASMLVSGGAPTGTYEIGDGETWEVVDTTGVTFDAAGVVKVESPDDPLFTDITSNVWVTIEQPDGEVAVQTSVYAVASLQGAAETPSIGVGHWGTVTDDSDQPTGEFVEATDGPAVLLRDGALVVSVPAPPPGDVRGNVATDVVDNVWVGPQPLGGTLPFAVSINQTAGEIVLFDFRSGFPVAVGGDPAVWTVQGFPPGGAPPGPYELVFSLQGLADTLGFAAAEPSAAVGIDRTVALVDGRLISYSGATGLVSWFEGTTGPTLQPVEDDVAQLEPAPPATTDDATTEDDRTWLYVAVAVAAALIVGGVAWALLVRRRSRPDEDPDQKEGRQPHAAGVSPDDALAALSRTVDEVSARIDDRPGSRVKTVSPPTPGSDRAKAEERRPTSSGDD